MFVRLTTEIDFALLLLKVQLNTAAIMLSDSEIFIVNL